MKINPDPKIQVDVSTIASEGPQLVGNLRVETDKKILKVVTDPDGTMIAVGIGVAVGSDTIASAGAKTVANAAVTATSKILVQRTAANASTAVGELTVTAQTAGVGFVVTSLTPGTPGTPLAADVSTFSYVIVG